MAKKEQQQLQLSSSDYIDQQRKEYSLYTLQMRAIPHAADGLKAAARRVLWTAKDGKKYKSATLAGATMPIHPHQAPEGTINTLASPYGNNVPLLHGIGSFGTLLKPTAYGASRYTSVTLSEFTKDVIFRDVEIVPMQDNYDGSLQEPKHFLPLVPVVLLNPQQGVAVGFASNILPRDLSEIVAHQITHLKQTNRKITEPFPYFTPIDQRAYDRVVNKSGDARWAFRGTFEKVNATSIRITGLPYGIVHEKYVEDKLAPLEEEGTIIDIDDNSKDHYNILIKFKKGVLSRLSDDDIYQMLSLESKVSENLNVINFDGQQVWSTSYSEMLTEFTNWRLGWYKARYERLASLLEIDIQRFKDILTAIKKNVNATAKKTQSRSELKNFLEEVGIVYIDYIADLPIYRFTEDEKVKVEKKLKDAETLLRSYKRLISSEDARKEVYIEELQEIQKRHKKGAYDLVES